MAIVETVTTKYTVDASGVDKGTKAAQAAVSKSSKSMKSGISSVTSSFKLLGAAAALAATAIVAKFVAANLESIDVLAKQSRTIGIAIDDLQAFQNMGNLAGTSTEFMSQSLQKMSLNIAKAADGTGLAVKELEKMGLANETFFNLNPTEQYKQIADKIADMGTAGEQATASMNIFQDANGKLIDTLKGGSAALEASQQEIKDLGKSISDVDAANVEKANDAMFRVGQLMSGIAQKVTIALAPALELTAKLFVFIGKSAGPVFTFIGKLLSAWFTAFDTFYTFVFKNILKFKIMYLEIFSSVSTEINTFINGAVNGFKLLAVKLLSVVESMPLIGDSATAAIKSVKAIEDVDVAGGINKELKETKELFAELEKSGSVVSLIMQKISDTDIGTGTAPKLEKPKPTGDDDDEGGGDNSAALKTNFDNLVASRRSEVQIEQDSFNERKQVVSAYYESLRIDGELSTENLAAQKELEAQIELEHGMKLVEINADVNARILADQEQKASQEKFIRDSQVAAVLDMSNTIIGISKNQSGKLATAAKITAIGATIAQGASAGIAALAPPPIGLGPLAGIPVAAAVALKTGVAVAKIGGALKRQTGGGVNPHSNVLVGENGPELIQFGARGGFVNNAESTQRLLNTNETNTTNLTTQVNFNINAIDAQGVQEFITNSREVIIDMITEAQDEFVGT